ncbi:MAG: cupredoxin domain-containing protein [Betaproteobacteria bacterium]
MTGISNCSGALNRRHILAVILLASAAPLAARGVQAEDAVSLSLTIKDGKFDPAELHAPAGRALEIHVTNLNTIPSEFESSDLHFEKIVPVSKEAVVRVRPQQPGRYNFFDDFHRETQGVLVVP